VTSQAAMVLRGVTITSEAEKLKRRCAGNAHHQRGFGEPGGPVLQAKASSATNFILALADRIQRGNGQRDLMPYLRIQRDIG
jgi:hypothetical protein